MKAASILLVLIPSLAFYASASPLRDRDGCIIFDGENICDGPIGGGDGGGEVSAGAGDIYCRDRVCVKLVSFLVDIPLCPASYARLY